MLDSDAVSSSGGDLVLYHDLSNEKLFPSDLIQLPEFLNEESSCKSSSLLLLEDLKI